ncbi:TetR/AcrR family transcriptional regulator [Agromyces sp. NPDC058484]|uniref:TetR/AcrR family transcriptional regulator n=1 Tax=Agromyces sp. NPDC058484 TaxID=3346524 RepID=UPI003651E31C
MTNTTHAPAKRADARRNIASILDAAAICLSRDPNASIGEIAEAAGVGRVTLYGHFSSRAELIDAVVARAIDEGNESLEAVDLSGDPRAALVRLIDPSWLSIVRIGALMTAAGAVLSPERMLELHERPASRVERLVERGRSEGVFRVDLPTSWLVGILHRVMHGAAAEIDAGRLSSDDAAAVIAATVLAAYTPPGHTVPRADTRVRQ